MTIYPSGKLKFCAPRAGHNAAPDQQFRVEPATFNAGATNYIQMYYKLEALDRRERMGSVRKR